jgi:hypothetical protein
MEVVMAQFKAKILSFASNYQLMNNEMEKTW